MIKYSELVKKTMPPEKLAREKIDIIGHYLLRPVSNIISIPLIEWGVSPTAVTIFSGIFPILAVVFFAMNSAAGFWGGWLSILAWNILDGVDGNIARFNDQCSLRGDMWDGTVGFMAVMAMFTGMGFSAAYTGDRFLNMGNELCIFGGIYAGWFQLFPKMMMYKRGMLENGKTIKSLKDRGGYGIAKVIAFNIASVNGLGAVLYLIAYLTNLCGVCLVFYFFFNGAVMLYSLSKILEAKS